MPTFRNRPLLYRPRRPFHLQTRANLLLGTTGLLSDNFRDRLTVASSNGFDGYGADLAWTVQSGAFACASIGRLTCSSAGIITADPGVADAIRFEFSPTAVTASGNALALRFVDTSNYIRCVCSTSAVNFATVIAGSATNIGTATTGVTPAAGDVVIGSLIGNAFAAQVYRAGVPVGTAASASNATGAGATPVGFRFGDTTFAVAYLKVRRSS